MMMEILGQWGLLPEKEAGGGDPAGGCHLSRHSGHVLPVDLSPLPQNDVVSDVDMTPDVPSDNSPT